MQGNPYLAKGEAKVILNEVTSNNPSQLKGYVEVAGKKAEVVIANPNGIHCDGCGVINANRATLTTGKPQLKDGDLDAFVVEKGKISTSGKGLDASRTDYTDIIAKEAKVNAGVWAKQKINVVTGKNTVKRGKSDENLQIIHQNQPFASEQSNETEPRFAVDVGELGGMYAGKIHLIGTEQGLGVHNAGHIGASSDDVVIDNQGKIINRGTINAANGIAAKSAQVIDNKGRIEAKSGSVELHTAKQIKQDGSVIARGGAVKAKAQSTINQQGETIAKGDIDYQAKTILADKQSSFAAGVTVTDTPQGEVRVLDNQSTSGATLRLSAEKGVVAQGKNIASGTVRVESETINLDHSQMGGYSVEAIAKAGNIEMNHAVVSSLSTMKLQTPATLTTRHSVLSANHFDTAQHDLDASNAVWKQTGDSDFHLTADSVHTEEATFASGGNFTVEAKTLESRKGILSSTKYLNINVSGRVNSAEGQLLSHNLTIHAGELNNERGLIYAQNSTVVNAKSVDNRHTQTGMKGIVGGRSLAINSESIDNQQGVIQSLGNFSLSGNQLDNRVGILSGARGNISVSRLDNRAVGVTGSLVHGSESLKVEAERLDNQGTKATGALPTQGIQSQQLAVKAGTLSNQNGGIYSADSTVITADKRLDNQQGEILSTNRVDIGHHGQLMVNNQDSLIQAVNSVELNAKGLEAQGNIKTQGDLTLHLKDDFTQNKAFEVGQNLTLTTEGSFENNSEQVVGNKITVSAKQINNTVTGEITGKETHLIADSLTNRGLIDGEKTLIQSGNTINIGTGRIYGDHLAFKSDSIDNFAETVNGETKAGTIAARKRLDFGVGTLTNRDHALILSLGEMYIGGNLNSQSNVIGKAKFLDNGSATIEVLGKAKINAERTLNHDLYLKTGTETSTETFSEYTPFGSSEVYYGTGSNKEGHLDWNNNNRRDKNAYFRFDNGTSVGSHTWHQKFYTRTTKTTTLEHQDPAKFSVGGDLELEEGHFTNNMSKVEIGEKLILGDKVFDENPTNDTLSNGNITLENIDLKGEIHRKDQGESSDLVVKRKRHGARGKKVWAHYTENIDSDFNRTLPVENFNFNLVLNTIGTKLPDSGASIEEQSKAKNVELSSLSVATDKNQVVNSGQVIGTIELPAIKTHLADIHLPEASLYRINPDSPNGYVVETDPKFADRRQWLSSDYMFTQLRYEPNAMQKRLGDGFYEQRLINEQINQLTGRRFIEGYENDLEQYKALMDSGIAYAKKFNLTPGVGLTAAQMSELTNDMVWMVEKEVTLANGQKVTVLTPQVYLVARNSDISAKGAVVSASKIKGNVDTLKNSGTIISDRISINSINIDNSAGKILAKDALYIRNKDNLVLHNRSLIAVTGNKSMLSITTKRIDKDKTSEVVNLGGGTKQVKVDGKYLNDMLLAENHSPFRRDLNYREEGILKEVTKDLPASEVSKYKDAANALVKASAGLSSDDEMYYDIKESEERGNSDELATYRETLTKKEIYHSVYWGGIKATEFKYTKDDESADRFKREHPYIAEALTTLLDPVVGKVKPLKSAAKLTRKFFKNEPLKKTAVNTTKQLNQGKAELGALTVKESGDIVGKRGASYKKTDSVTGKHPEEPQGYTIYQSKSGYFIAQDGKMTKVKSPNETHKKLQAARHGQKVHKDLENKIIASRPMLNGKKVRAEATLEIKGKHGETRKVRKDIIANNRKQTLEIIKPASKSGMRSGISRVELLKSNGHDSTRIHAYNPKNPNQNVIILNKDKGTGRAVIPTYSPNGGVKYQRVRLGLPPNPTPKQASDAVNNVFKGRTTPKISQKEKAHKELSRSSKVGHSQKESRNSSKVARSQKDSRNSSKAERSQKELRGSSKAERSQKESRSSSKASRSQKDSRSSSKAERSQKESRSSSKASRSQKESRNSSKAERSQKESRSSSRSERSRK